MGRAAVDRDPLARDVDIAAYGRVGIEAHPAGVALDHAVGDVECTRGRIVPNLHGLVRIVHQPPDRHIEIQVQIVRQIARPRFVQEHANAAPIRRVFRIPVRCRAPVAVALVHRVTPREVDPGRGEVRGRTRPGVVDRVAHVRAVVVHGAAEQVLRRGRELPLPDEARVDVRRPRALVVRAVRGAVVEPRVRLPAVRQRAGQRRVHLLRQVARIERGAHRVVAARRAQRVELQRRVAPVGIQAVLRVGHDVVPGVAGQAVHVLGECVGHVDAADHERLVPARVRPAQVDLAHVQGDRCAGLRRRRRQFPIEPRAVLQDVCRLQVHHVDPVLHIAEGHKVGVRRHVEPLGPDPIGGAGDGGDADLVEFAEIRFRAGPKRAHLEPARSRPVGISGDGLNNGTIRVHQVVRRSVNRCRDVCPGVHRRYVR